MDILSKEIQHERQPALSEGGLRILVVDDSALMRMAVKRILFEHDKVAHIDIAEDGQQALDLVRQNEYDMIFTDLEMPNISGAEFIRRSHCLTDSPIIVLSSAAEKRPEEMERALCFGALGYVAKPRGTLNSKATEIYQYVDNLVTV